MHFNRSAFGALAATALLGTMATAAEARTFNGMVVHHNPRAHSFVVADRTGHLFAVHAAHAPRIGSEVSVSAKRLRDGTYKLQREHGTRRAGNRVRVRGVVSYVNRRTGEFTLSAPGVSLLVVHVRRRTVRAASATPSIGSDVVATGTVDDRGDLEDQTVQTVGQDTNGIELEGTVVAVDSSARTISVSADDNDQSGFTMTVTVPSGLDMSQFSQGEEVELVVQPTSATTATLLGSADDENAQSADDQAQEQGDNPGQDDQGEDSASQASGSANESSGSGSSEPTDGGSDGAGGTD
jgi:hypothetical protein